MNDEIKAIIIRACKAYHGAMFDPYSDYTYTPDKAVEDIMEMVEDCANDVLEEY
jgi:hypothetical protein